MQGSIHRSVASCARTVYRTEGLQAFYISYPTTLTMNVPFTAVQFSVYETLKDLLNPTGEYSPSTHVIAGGVAGGVAAAVTTPLDVAKVGLSCAETDRWLTTAFPADPPADPRPVRGPADTQRPGHERGPPDHLGARRLPRPAARHVAPGVDVCAEHGHQLAQLRILQCVRGISRCWRLADSASRSQR